MTQQMIMPNSYFLSLPSLRAARKHYTRRFFEGHSRGNRRIVLRNQPEYRGAYAFNRIVNPFLSSVRAEQLENCMQMQKYSGECARARTVISYRFSTSAFLPLFLSYSSSFARFSIFQLFQRFRLPVSFLFFSFYCPEML